MPSPNHTVISHDQRPDQRQLTMRVMTVLGTRPEYVKAAALSRAIAMHNAASGDDPGAVTVEEIIVDTGQHYDHQMSALFIDELGLSSAMHNLGVGSATHGVQTGAMLDALDPMISSISPDLVVVYGDTNSTLSGALTAAKSVIPLAHIESGLRSYDRSMPEEINRVVTDHLATLRLCPSELAVANLAAEGITEGVALTGDVNFDVLRHQLGDGAWTQRLVNRRGLVPGSYALATVHRVENTDDTDRLDAILGGLSDLANAGRPVCFPLHPRTRQQLNGWTPPPGVSLIDPVGFLEMLALQLHAAVVITDSGGVQKEAFWLETPCLTLRDRTEWSETVAAAWNTLVDADRQMIFELGLDPVIPSTLPPPVYGSGAAADRIVRDLVSWWQKRVTT